MGKTRDQILDKVVDKAQKSPRGGELNLGQAVKELAQTDDIGNAVDARRIAKGRGRIRKSRFGSDIQEDLFNNDVLNAAAAAGGRTDNYNNKLRSNFVATRGSGANDFTDQANGLGILEGAGANWDNYRTGQEVANGPRRSGSSRNNYGARPTGDYQAQGYASQDLNDYLVNRYNKYDLLPQFRQGNVGEQGYVPGMATSSGLNLKEYYDKVVANNDAMHAWTHVNDDVTQTGLNAAFGDNIAAPGSHEHDMIEKIYERTGSRGDKQLLKAMEENPEMRAQTMLGGLLHDIGNYGFEVGEQGLNADQVKTLNKMSRDIHNATGMAMLNGNFPTSNNPVDIENWLKTYAPEAYSKHILKAGNEATRNGNIANFQRIIDKAKDLRANDPNTARFNTLENILNQSGYNENTKANLNDIIQSVERHRNSASEMFDKAKSPKDKLYNPRWAKQIKQNTLPNSPMSYAVSLADKLGDEIRDVDLTRTFGYGTQTKMDENAPGAAGNVFGGLGDAIDFLTHNGKGENVANHHSYTDWGKAALNTTRGAKDSLYRQAAGAELSPEELENVKQMLGVNNRDQALQWILDRAFANLPEGSLGYRKYMNSNENDAAMNAFRQLQALNANPRTRYKAKSILQNMLAIDPNTGGVMIVNPYTGQPLPKAPNGKNQDYTSLVSGLQNDPEAVKSMGGAPMPLRWNPEILGQ